MDAVNNNASGEEGGPNLDVSQQQMLDESSRDLSSGSLRITRPGSNETIRLQSNYNLRSRGSSTGHGEVKENEPVAETPKCALKRKGQARSMAKSVASSLSGNGNWNRDAVDLVMTRNLNEMTMMTSLLLALPFVLYGIISALGLFLDWFYWCTWMWTILFSLAFYFHDITGATAKRTKEIVHGVLLFLLFFIQCSDFAEAAGDGSHSKSKVTQVPCHHDVEIVEITSGDPSEQTESSQEAI